MQCGLSMSCDVDIKMLYRSWYLSSQNFLSNFMWIERMVIAEIVRYTYYNLSMAVHISAKL